jgi:hypothetical protein
VEGACPAIIQECAYLISDSYAYDFVVAKLPDRQLRLADFPGSVFRICRVKFKVLEQELRRFQTRLEEIENDIEGDIPSLLSNKCRQWRPEYREDFGSMLTWF